MPCLSSVSSIAATVTARSMGMVGAPSRTGTAGVFRRHAQGFVHQGVRLAGAHRSGEAGIAGGRFVKAPLGRERVNLVAETGPGGNRTRPPAPGASITEAACQLNHGRRS